MKKVLLISLTILLMASTSFALSYSTDFELSVGSEWSNSTTSTNTTFSKFLGRFGNQSTTLSLTGLGSGAHNVTLTFDFYAIDSWDGTGSNGGPDIFGINGDFTDSWSVANSTFSSSGTFPYTLTSNGNYGFGSWTDDIYRNISINFSTIGDSLTLSFYASGLQALDDESWGIDNVSVHTTSAGPGNNPVPEPATFILLGSGLAGLAFYRRKRK